MGTNYYWHREKKDACPHCGHTPGPYAPIHIGKSSAGWTFSFHATGGLRSWKRWRRFLETEKGEIRDEYGKHVPLEIFIKLVVEKQGVLDNKRHAEESRRWSDYNSYLDEDGFSFSEGDFS